MRKLSLGFLVLLTLLTAFSCATKPATFSSVYADFKKALILEDATTYTVVSGDNLTKITEKYYGANKGYYFPLILAASYETVDDPDLIQPGMVLTIPNFERNVNNPAVKPNIKRAFKKVANIYVEKGNDFVAKKLIEIADSI